MPAACSQTIFLRAGAEFRGRQKTGSRKHEMRAEIKSVDFNEGFLCGYLETAMIADRVPVMKTYFEGEIIGPHYQFITKHPEWGASALSDVQHWHQFKPFKAVTERVADPYNETYVFMRWKEKCLVADKHEELPGASFDGFYYVYLSQLTGQILGYYYQRGQLYQFQHVKLDHIWPGCDLGHEWR